MVSKLQSNLGGPNWLGGKSGAWGAKGTGRWIAKRIPYDHFYFEPYAGMLGILLQRRPSQREMVNDLDNTVFTFWKVVRDQPDQLRRRLDGTPIWCRETFYEALAVQNDADQADDYRAWALVVTTKWGVKKEGPQPRKNWRYASSSSPVWVLQVERLAARLQKVFLENRPAEQLVAEGAHLTNAVWYLDPPYPQAPNCYRFGEPPDLEVWTPLLSRVAGKVAISGYGDTWDHLGWHRSVFTTTGTVGHHTDTRDTQRVEVLWTNYPPTDGTLF